MEVKKTYRFGFVLTTAAGNMTRYLNLRKYAERDAGVECVWAPIKHYLEPDPFHRLPGPLRSRAIVMHEAAPVMSQFSRLDAIMFHAFEPYVVSVIKTALGGGRRSGRRPLVVWSQDNPPMSDPSRHPQYGGSHARSRSRQRLRFRFDAWCARHVSLFFPWSRWAADVFTQECGIAPEKVHVINVGIDLELWPFLRKADAPADTRPQILFVGGDFVRKGGDLLLDVFTGEFAEGVDLHLVTKQPPKDLPRNVHVYTDMNSNDPRLRRLYADADLFVLPTRADVSSIVAMEAMATGRPVIATRMGGIPDIVRDGETGFLIEPDDGVALADRMRVLLTDAALRQKMGTAGRTVVESNFSAAACVPRILSAMKQAVGA